MEIYEKIKDFVIEHAVTIGCCAATAVVTYMVTKPSTVETVVSAKNGTVKKELTKAEKKKEKKEKKKNKRNKRNKKDEETIKNIVKSGQ